MTLVEQHEFVDLRWRHTGGRRQFRALSITEGEARTLVDSWRYERISRIEVNGRRVVLQAIQPPRRVPAEIVVTDDGTRIPLAHLVRRRRPRRGSAGMLELPGVGRVDWRVPDWMCAEYGFVTPACNLVLFSHSGVAVTGIDGDVTTADGVPVLDLLLCLGWFLLLLQWYEDDGRGGFPYGPVPRAVPPRPYSGAAQRGAF